MVGFVVDDGDVNVSYHGEKDIFVNEDVRVLCIIFQNLFDLRNEKKRKEDRNSLMCVKMLNAM